MSVELEWTYPQMLAVAIREARTGLEEGGIPSGAAMFHSQLSLLASGRNRVVQASDPLAHAEADVFRRAARLDSYGEVVMVTTLAPCWQCSGLIRQFGIRTVIIGESRSYRGGIDWLRSIDVKVVDLDSDECFTLMQGFIRDRPEIWKEEIGRFDSPNAIG